VRPVLVAADPPASATAEAEEHLRAAEEAYRSNQPLRQFAEADLALKANPRSVDAKYLYADALIKAGDLDNGCKSLAEIKRDRRARARARAVKCPGD
jgi:thioredoxin-like negative regulator of GroEL